MKVHLLRSEEVTPETYTDVMHILNQVPGPLRWVNTEAESTPQLDEMEEREWLNATMFHGKVFPVAQAPRSESRSRFTIPRFKISFPHREKFMSWDHFFNICRMYRSREDVGEEEMVVLLTDIANDMNWFAAGEEGARNAFIHTKNWGHFFGYDIDSRFPISYLVASQVLQRLMFRSYDELKDHIHQKPLGCMMDFCQDKRQIILKMRTGDICTDCLHHIKDRNIDLNIVEQVLQIMDSIRGHLLFRERFDLFNQPSKMEVRGHMQKIFLTDLGDLQVKLSPLERTLYLFFLNHPEGIMLSHLQDHREEIGSIYERLSNSSDLEAIQNRISDLVSPMSNSASEKISRIRSRFVDACGEKMAEHFVIAGPNGEKKKILLDRKLVELVD